jgi:hypothetical protein
MVQVRSITPIFYSSTIVPDHCFLECSGGEGEGAISELIVFSGRLDERDICTIESYLMSKHGICFLPSSDLSISSCGITRKENMWTKQAHALLVSGDISDIKFNKNAHPVSVPLKFLARHRSVAWQYHNAVTGKRIHTAKIGCRDNVDSSSDW